MHKFIEERLTAAEEEFKTRKREFEAAQRLLEELHLLPMLDWALNFSVFEDYTYDYDLARQIPVDRYMITIRIPGCDKPQVHHLLRACLDIVGEWKADKRVDTVWTPKATPMLIERWNAKWDRSETYSVNTIHIEYLFDAIEGLIISPTCSIQRVAQRKEARVEHTLTLVCTKPEED